MKVRDNEMPDEFVWAGIFSPESVLASFNINVETEFVVEFGCGTGNYTLPVARVVAGAVFAYDIDPEMVAAVCEKCTQEGIGNVVAEHRDLVAEGTGLPADFADVALLFNVLHQGEPAILINEAYRVLKPGGIAAVIHWKYDETTPIGPSIKMPPHPEQCIEWGKDAGFIFYLHERFDFRPNNYWLQFRKPL